MTHAVKALAAATIFSLGGFAAAHAEDNPWMVRGRLIHVMPDESGDISVGGAALPGDVDIDTSVVPELDITYFFNDNWAMELILGVTPHDVKATDLEVAAVPFGPADVDLGDVWLLPPTLTLQYHFDTGSQFKPYVGAGVNFTHFFNEDSGPVADDISYDSSFGGALQVGFDYDLDGEKGGWAFNADVKKVWINTDVEIDVTTAFGAALGASSVIVDADVDINPFIVGVGLGYKY